MRTEPDDFAWESARSIVLTYQDGVSHPPGGLVLGTGTINVLSPCATCPSPVGIQMLASSGALALFIVRRLRLVISTFRIEPRSRNSACTGIARSEAAASPPGE